MTALSPSDRALIDAAVARGAVTHIPRGVSGIPLPVWDGTKLVSGQPNALKKANDAFWRRKRVDPALAERRRKLCELFAQGKSDKEIAEALGIALSSVKKDRKRAGLKRDRVKAQPKPKIKAPRPSQGKRDEALALYQGGMKPADIAALMGMTPNAIRKYLREALGTLTWDRFASARQAAETKRARRG